MDPADRAAFGEFLRQARERRQVTLEQIANDTKIASRHLSALEQGNVKALPGGMYRRAMLRAYADSIGLDREAALEQFERTFEPQQRPAPSPAAPPVQAEAVGSVAVLPRPARPRDLRVLLGIVVVSAAAVVGLVTGDETGGVRSIPVPSVAEPQPPAATAPEPVVTPSKAADPAPDPPAVATTASEIPDPASAATASTRTSSPVPAEPLNVNAPAQTLSAPAPRESTRTAAPAATVSRATSGQLAIVTVPAGARVTVNGTGWGTTPVTVRLLPFGTKRVRVTHDGYVSQERVVTLSPERPSGTLSVTLAPRE